MSAGEIQCAMTKASDEVDAALSRFYTSTVQLTRAQLTCVEIAAIYNQLALEFTALGHQCEVLRKIAEEKADFHSPAPEGIR